MRKELAADVELSIFIRDHDLDSETRYDSILVNCWTDTEAGPVYYASPNQFTASGLKRAMAGDTLT